MSLGCICMGKYSHIFFKKVLGLIEATGVFESPLFRNGQFECFVHILRGPWSILNTYDLTQKCRLLKFFQVIQIRFIADCIMVFAFLMKYALYPSQYQEQNFYDVANSISLLLQNFLILFEIKKNWRFRHIFVAFSEYMNFTYRVKNF